MPAPASAVVVAVLQLVRRAGGGESDRSLADAARRLIRDWEGLSAAAATANAEAALSLVIPEFHAAVAKGDIRAARALSALQKAFSDWLASGAGPTNGAS